MLARLRSIQSSLTHPLRASMSTHTIPSKMRACQIQAQGGLEVLQVVEVDVPKPGPGQVLYKCEWAGVNFIDTYQRSGIYKLPMPQILGNESSGTVVAVGEGVDAETHGFAVGDKVAAYTVGGSFADYVLTQANKAIKLPEGISTRDAATVLLQGLTALTFVNEAHEVKKGEFILIQACAGGLGLLLAQLAKARGAHVIGTTSTPAKASLARAAGASEVILYGPNNPDVDVVKEVYKITGGEGVERGVHAVFDGVGKDTFEMAFEVVRRKGTIVTLGNASGPVPAFVPLKLAAKNLKVCRPTLGNYIYTREEVVRYTTELFDIVKAGDLKLSVHAEYPLTTEGLVRAQTDIASRATSGKLLIKVA